ADGAADGGDGGTGGGLLPVLAARDVAVTDTAERMFPRTTTTRVRGVTDLDGWTHGTEAADRARTGGGSGSRRGPDGQIMA
ncbi:aromatic acid decarboxylase, partial [Streptomyces anulatus]|nr:aromatic acid decarboxylase [Streptomyces anulatus]